MIYLLISPDSAVVLVHLQQIVACCDVVWKILLERLVDILFWVSKLDQFIHFIGSYLHVFIGSKCCFYQFSLFLLHACDQVVDEGVSGLVVVLLHVLEVFVIFSQELKALALGALHDLEAGLIVLVIRVVFLLVLLLFIILLAIALVLLSVIYLFMVDAVVQLAVVIELILPINLTTQPAQAKH